MALKPKLAFESKNAWWMERTHNSVLPLTADEIEFELVKFEKTKNEMKWELKMSMRKEIMLK